MSVDSLLSSKTGWKIIKCFFSKPWEKHYLRDICRAAKTNPNSTHRILKEMKKTGLLTMEKAGRTILYIIDKENSYTKKLLELYFEDKLENLGEFKVYVNRLKRKISDFSTEIISAVLFGSVAKGKAGKYSDIDILLITKKGMKKNEKLEDIFKPYSRHVQFIYYSQKEFENEYSSGNELIINILQHGIVLYDENFYYPYLFKVPPKPTKEKIEKNLEYMKKRIDEIWKIYGSKKHKHITLSAASPMLYPISRQIAAAILLLNSKLPESRHAIPKQLSEIGERELANILIKTRKCWDGEIEDLREDDVSKILTFLENKIQKCYEKLEVFQ